MVGVKRAVQEVEVPQASMVYCLLPRCVHACMPMEELPLAFGGCLVGLPGVGLVDRG